MATPIISLAQFNKIATGDYNAGLVDFKTDENGNVQNALKKVNHHVHKTGKNNVVLSSERILEVKEAFIQALRGGGVDEASINEVRAKLGIPTEVKLTTDRETARTVLGNPKTFASAITDILFDEFDALSEGLDEKEEGKLKGDVYFVATGELGLGYWDALKEANILNALMKDAQKMGGDKDYKVDIGV